LCVKLVIYKDYTEVHGQQNIQFWGNKGFESWSAWKYVLLNI